MPPPTFIFALLFLRIAYGIILFLKGYDALKTGNKRSAYLSFLAGSLLLVGLFIQPLVLVYAIALILPTARKFVTPDIWQDRAIHLLLFASSTVLALLGGGAWSLDRIIPWYFLPGGRWFSALLL